MTFIHPLGFLALLAIPFLIAIYIIKSKYTEQTIGSTYLWELSERFLKRKNPISRLTGIISLILQILAVILISFAVAHPVFTLKGQAEDYLFILDCSGSMNFVEDGETRFDKAKDYIKDVISSSKTGSSYTLITAGDATDEVFKRSEDKKAVLLQLENVKCAYADNDLSEAIGDGQEYFDANPAQKIYLLTDKKVEGAKNIEVVTFSAGGDNFALSEASFTFVSGGARASVLVSAYGKGGTVTVQAFEDGAEQPSGEAIVQLEEGGAEVVTFDIKDALFNSLKLVIKEKDALDTDNEVTLYNVRRDSSYKTLIVSEAPAFLSSALSVLGNVQSDTVIPEEFEDSMAEGYGLYIFEGFTPAKMPSDGAVWFVNPTGTVENSGFAVNGTEELDSAALLEYSKSSANKVKTILNESVDRTEEVSLKSYVRCNQFRSFTNLLSCNGNPVMFIGSNSYGNREAVFAFDFHWSDFVLSYNFAVIINNLLRYTFPSVVDTTLYYCGDTVEVNVLANCTSIRLDAPDGKYEYLDTSSETSGCRLSGVGEYTVTVIVGNDTRVINIYSQLPLSERASTTSASYSINGEPSGEKRDGRYEDILYIFIVLAVIVVADWAVYCYEQYQLR